MTPISFRGLAFAGFLLPTFAMAFALYLQYVLHLEPCPLCIFQRVAMIAIALVWLLAAIHGPQGAGRWVYAVFAAAAAAAGGAIAWRHVWLQGLPPEEVPACGPSLDYMLDIQPLNEVIATVLKGDGDCAAIEGAFLGLSIPAWTLIAFVGLALASLLVPLLSRREAI